MTEAYNPVPKCRICQKHHWLRDGCSGDFQKRRQPAAAPPPKAKRKTKKRKAK